MATTLVSNVSSFTIRELTGTTQREIRLIGRALPYRPFSLTTQQRVELTWYPGNPEATSTILGASEGPTQLRGYWKSKFLGEAENTSAGSSKPFTLNGAGVSLAKDAVYFMDLLVQAGQLL